MKAKNWNRLLLAFWILYMTIAQLGATGSYEQAGAAFGILVLTAFLAWMERDYTKVGADDTAIAEYEAACTPASGSGVARCAAPATCATKTPAKTVWRG